VWGPGYGTESQYLRVYASQLRKKINDDPESPRLITEPGVGYRLVDREAEPHGDQERRAPWVRA
jgi:DNA-binding response OmpR family regulator